MLHRLCCKWTSYCHAKTFNLSIFSKPYVGPKSNVFTSKRLHYTLCKTYRKSQRSGFGIPKYKHVSAGNSSRKGVLAKIKDFIFRRKSSSLAGDKSQLATKKKAPTSSEIKRLLSLAKSEKWKLVGKIPIVL